MEEKDLDAGGEWREVKWDHQNGFQLITISPIFWKHIAQWKLNTVKAQDKAILPSIQGLYSAGRPGLPSRLRFDDDSFLTLDNEKNPPIKDEDDEKCALRGSLVLFDQHRAFLDNTLSMKLTNDLDDFVIYAWADLKRWTFEHVFALKQYSFSGGPVKYHASCQVIEDSISSSVVDSCGEEEVFGWPVCRALYNLHRKHPTEDAIQCVLRIEKHNKTKTYRFQGQVTLNPEELLVTRKHLKVDLSSHFDPSQYTNNLLTRPILSSDYSIPCMFNTM